MVDRDFKFKFVEREEKNYKKKTKVFVKYDMMEDSRSAMEKNKEPPIVEKIPNNSKNKIKRKIMSGLTS